MGAFVTTRWSLVLRASQAEPAARAALEELCRLYHPAVLAFLRRNGQTREAAEDQAQQFFAELLQARSYEQADPERGRFRNYLLTLLRRSLGHERERAQALKRGGGQASGSEGEFELERLTADDSPDRAFARGWALSVLDRAQQRLGDEMDVAGRSKLYRDLREFLAETPDGDDYRRVAELHAMRPNTVAVAVHRLRLRLRELVREELSETVDGSEQLEQEMEAWRAALRD